ncbi:ABC transporter G family member 10 [Andrographis paniculata]|uniref:ABC transporter G family member 10 n=1 Tax=Andrographis paniculata TaxID=175694 RepID=UPI0021E74C1E|nr:ABC transporter G family member 10 [Andrographis paniculata]
MELPVRSPAPAPVRRSNSYTIEARNLSYTWHSPYDPMHWPFFGRDTDPNVSSSRVIVKNASLVAKPGEITAIAGPSGAGKTTLLEILAGKIPLGEVSGEVLVNGCPVRRGMFRRLSGYVTQDDALFPLLTVEETLTYSALLRMRGGRRVASQRVKMLMHDLGLDQVARSRVGQGSSGGISGGERRRLSIGVELVHDPPVLLVDEPTSGLDSASALHIVSLLKLMVLNQGKTVVLSIHQPGFRILELFDRLVLLSHGRVLHNGSLLLLENSLLRAGHRIPSHINILEFAIEVANTICDEATQCKIDDRMKFDHNSSRNEETTPSYTNSYIKEVQILGDRFCKNIFRTKELFATKAIQSILVGSILGTVYIKLNDNHGQVALQTRLGFFAFTLSFLLSSTTEGLPIFLQERRIFNRETSSGSYRVTSYVTANTLVFLPFLLLISLLYSTPAYWLVGLRRDTDGFLYFVLVVWLVVLTSNSFTAFCSALVPNFIMGTSIIAGLMGSFFLFSGYFIARADIPIYWLFMHYVSLFKYPFESLIVNEYGGKGRDKCLEKLRNGECVVYGEDYLRQQGLKETLKWTNLGVMLGFILGYRFLCFCILWYKSCRINKGFL